MFLVYLHCQEMVHFSHYVYRLIGQVPGHNWLTAMGARWRLCMASLENRNNAKFSFP